MSTDTAELSKELAAQTAPAPARTMRETIERMRPELEKSLASKDAAAMLMRFYLTALRLNPKLLDCTTESLLAGLLLSAQVGLEPGPLGHVYLVPYGKECVWMLGYTGIVHLARDGGAVGLASEIVWDCDTYEAPWRDERGIHYLHRPGPIDERTARVRVLVTWSEYAQGKRIAHAWDVPPSRIERARKASPAFKRGGGIWVDDEDAAWRKTGVRFVRPYLPLTARLARAVASDDAVLRTVEPDDDGAAQPVLETAEAVEVEA